MITIEFFFDKKNNHKGFKASGHAGYAESGEDIVCSAVSVLEYTTVNSIDQLTSDGEKLEIGIDEEDGTFALMIKGILSERGNILMDSLLLGFKSLSQEYDKYIDLIIKEV